MVVASESVRITKCVIVLNCALGVLHTFSPFVTIVVKPLRKMGRSRREGPVHWRRICYCGGFGTFLPSGELPLLSGKHF